MGGGNSGWGENGRRAVGLSPRGRGKRVDVVEYLRPRRSIPAWAGETLRGDLEAHVDTVYPRVGGGNLAAPRVLARYIGLSPRGRGKHGEPEFPALAARSIPAWAGETYLEKLGIDLAAVYPRVGGGNLIRRGFLVTTYGLSPRGRGKRLCSRCKPSGDRSIPAWAGETGGALFSMD